MFHRGYIEKAALLGRLFFFTKGDPTKEVWYYEHPYPPGAKSYNKTKPMRIEEFEPEKKWWDNRTESEFAWKVPLQQIIDSNYNLDIKNPNIEEESHRDPEDLLKEYNTMTKDLSSTRDSLKKQLTDALGDSRK